MSADEMPQLWSRHLNVAIESDVVTISYEPSSELTLGSALRSRDILNRVAAKLKGARPGARYSDGEQITSELVSIIRASLRLSLRKSI
jgi:hypothetical protein